MTPKTGTREWYAWGGVTVAAFAVMEARALRSGGQRATLSYVCRTHARRSTATKAATAAFAAWAAYHILFETYS